jgi:hypothetical protein
MQTINTAPKKGQPLIILQGAHNRSQVAMDAKKILAYTLGRLSLSPREHCVFEFVYNGPQNEIPTRKKERELFLCSHIKALCSRLASRALWAPVPDAELRDSKLLNVRGPELEARHATLPSSGVVGMGALACEVLTGNSQVGQFDDCVWETLPPFQRVGIQKAWITRDIIAALMDPSLTVGISGTLAHAAMDAGLPVKALPAWEYKGTGVDEIYLAYQSKQGQEMFSQGRGE